MKILHICQGLEPTNGAANIARLIVREQQRAGDEVWLVRRPTVAEWRAADEVWFHCGWYPLFWRLASALRRRRPAPKIFWMPEGCYDPVRLAHHGWKKRLAGFFERRALRRATTIYATCAAEAEWIRRYVGRNCPRVEETDIRRFFPVDLAARAAKRRALAARPADEPRHVLYLGRRHPLKGVRYLEAAARALGPKVELRLVSDHTGAELADDWAWADVLCLPTLSENFGLVVAEALQRGVPVITTDGAPAWSDLRSEDGVYLRGFRAGSDATRRRAVREALFDILNAR